MSRLNPVLGAGVFLEFIEAYGAACVHVRDALADAIEHPGLLGWLAKLLIGGGVLHDQLGFAVDDEDNGITRLFQLRIARSPSSSFVSPFSTDPGWFSGSSARPR
jgi:hypothetical protein